MNFNVDKIKFFCINLKRSKERREIVTMEFVRRGLDVEFWNAIDKKDIYYKPSNVKMKDGEYACFLSQLKLIQYAKDNHYEAVCIFEDDVVLCDDFWNRINYLMGLDGFDFDIFHLGGHFTGKDSMEKDSEKTEWEYIYKTKQIYGCYAYVVANNVYDWLINNVTFIEPWDNYVSSALKHFNGYCMVPFIANVRPCISDINDIYLDYGGILNHQFSNEIEEMKPINRCNLNGHDLSNVTFIIPFTYDTEQRLENLNFVLRFLQKNFSTNIIVVEHSIEKKFNVDCFVGVRYIYEKNDTGFTHKTRMFNKGVKMAKTKYICLYDCDVFFPTVSIVNAVEMLNGGYSMVFPYDGQFVDVDRTVVENDRISNPYNVNPKSDGGAVFLNRHDFIKAGMDNENFVSWGFEDNERPIRMEKLGYKVGRTSGQCYHIRHHRGPNSGPNNPYWKANDREFQKVKSMSKEDLENYIHEWSWRC